jgi:hypothetical protein
VSCDQAPEHVGVGAGSERGLDAGGVCRDGYHQAGDVQVKRLGEHRIDEDILAGHNGDLVGDASRRAGQRKRRPLRESDDPAIVEAEVSHQLGDVTRPVAEGARRVGV